MISRARPLLGTLVAIRTDAGMAAVQAAFAAIERVQALMGPDEAGDVARLRREGVRRAIAVHPWTFRVLRCARRVSRASRGAFDVTLGEGGASEERDIELLQDCRVRLRRPARLELGGIAKGFAVDRAVEALRRHGARSGSVNAGGDLRVFGAVRQTIRVRLPGRPQESVPIAAASEGAFATSAGYHLDELLDARTGAPLCGDSSITVASASCMVADALTKAVAALGPSPDLLAPFGARAYRIEKDGRMFVSARAGARA